MKHILSGIRYFALCSNWNTDIDASISLIQTVIKNSEEDRLISPIMYYVGSLGFLNDNQINKQFIYQLHQTLEDSGFVLRVALSDGEELNMIEAVGISVEAGWVTLPNLPMILFASRNNSWIDEFTGINFDYLQYDCEEEKHPVEQYSAEENAKTNIVILCCGQKNSSEHFSEILVNSKDHIVVYNDGSNNHIVSQTYKKVLDERITFLGQSKNNVLTFRSSALDIS